MYASINEAWGDEFARKLNHIDNFKPLDTHYQQYSFAPKKPHPKYEREAKDDRHQQMNSFQSVADNPYPPTNTTLTHKNKNEHPQYVQRKWNGQMEPLSFPTFQHYSLFDDYESTPKYNCYDIWQHIQTCKGCRRKIQEDFCSSPIEHFSPIRNPNHNNLITLLLFGIFIIFCFDFFKS